MLSDQLEVGQQSVFVLSNIARTSSMEEDKDKVRENLLKDSEKVTERSEERERVTFDDILSHLGEFGLEQKINYLKFSLPYVMSAMQLMGWVFVGAEISHRCRLPEEVGLEGRENISFHSNNSDWETTSCSRTLKETNLTEYCEDGWVYDRSQVEDSVTSDWDLVCNNEGLRATIGASPMSGYLAGGFVFGILTDKIGRKPTFMLANFLMMTGGLLGAVSPEFFTFVISRMITGFAIAGVEAACFVMGMELVGPSKRTLAGIVCWFFETTGLLSALGLAYLVRDDWRLLQVLYSAPAVVFLAYWWAAPESIRWLVARGRTEEAAELIQRAARRNKVEVREELILAMEETIKLELAEEEAGRTYTAVDLFRYPNLRCKTLILLLCWITCASLYYVLLLDQSELSDNKYVGFLITAGVQIPGYVYVILTLEQPMFGRKKSLCLFLILCGLALSTHPLVPADYPTVRITISVIGRFAANCSYTILNLFSAEQFPTVVRGVGMGFAVVVSRTGTMLAPYILLLGHFSPVIFGLSALLSGLCALLLPETLGKKMPETLQDGEKLAVRFPGLGGRE